MTRGADKMREFIRTNWRWWVLTGIGALILWEGFHEIDDIYETYALACPDTSPYSRCRGIHEGFLGLIIVMAAIGFPYALGKWWAQMRSDRASSVESSAEWLRERDEWRRDRGLGS